MGVVSEVVVESGAEREEGTAERGGIGGYICVRER